jgi:hypothetical protein
MAAVRESEEGGDLDILTDPGFSDGRVGADFFGGSNFERCDFLSPKPTTTHTLRVGRRDQHPLL